MIARAVARWAQFVNARPRMIAGVVVIVTLAAAGSLRWFEIDPDVSSLFPEDNEVVELMRATALGEEASRNLYLILEGEALEARMPGFIESLESSEFLTRVDGRRADFGGALVQRAARAPLWYLPEETLEALEQRLGGEGRAQAIQESKELLATDPLAGRDIVLRDPLGLRWLLGKPSGDALADAFEGGSPYLMLAAGGMAVIRVQGKEDPFDVDFSLALLQDVEERLAGTSVRPVGGYAIAREDSTRIKGDLRSSLLWSIPTILLFLTLSTRSLLQPHLYVIPVGLAILWTLGFGGLLLGPMTPLGISSAAILTGLGVDTTIHYLGRFREERSGDGVARALERTHALTAPVLLGSVLTSVGAFLSVALGSFPGLRTLGLLLALGLILALISTWTVLPLLLRLFPDSRSDDSPGPVMAAMVRLNRSRLARPAALVLAGLALLGWLLAARGGLTFDANPERLRPDDSVISLARTDLEDQLGFAPLGVAILVSDEYPVDVLSKAAEQLTRSGVVAATTGAHRSWPSEARRQRVAGLVSHSRGWVDATLEDLRGAGFRPQPFRAGLEEFDGLLCAELPLPGPTEGKFEWRGTSYWKSTFHPPRSLETPAERREFRSAVSAALGVPARMLEPGALADELGPLMARELRDAILGLSLVVLVLVVLSVKSLRYGLVALLPVVCGLGISLGLLTVLGWPLHPGNLLALPLILGLGVDDGLHMVHRAREARADPIRTTGVQVWRTTGTTALGFGSLVTASSPVIASLGSIVLVGTLVCFLTSVILVPQLMRNISRE